MKGLQEELRDREERHSRVEKREISEEAIERNSKVLLELEPGMEIDLEYYCAFHDVRRHGLVELVDIPFRRLKIDGETVPFDDIYTITVTERKKVKKSSRRDCKSVTNAV